MNNLPNQKDNKIDSSCKQYLILSNTNESSTTNDPIHLNRIYVTLTLANVLLAWVVHASEDKPGYLGDIPSHVTQPQFMKHISLVAPRIIPSINATTITSWQQFVYWPTDYYTTISTCEVTSWGHSLGHRFTIHAALAHQKLTPHSAPFFQDRHDINLRRMLLLKYLNHSQIICL